MADDLWGLFGEDDDAEDSGNSTAAGGSDGAQPQPQRPTSTMPPSAQPLPTGAVAAEHPFFAQSKLWPPPGSPLDDLQVLKRALMDDMANHLTPSVLQTIESGEGATTAASKLEDMRQALRDGNEQLCRDSAKDFVDAAVSRLSEGGGGGFEEWSVALLFACACAAVHILIEADLVANPSGTEAERQGRGREALKFLDVAIINSCRMEQGSSRWEYPYLQGTVGQLVMHAEAAAGDIAQGAVNPPEPRPPHLLLLPMSLPSSGVPSILPERRLEARGCSSLPLLAFLNEYLARHRPVLIQGYMEHCGWAALGSWGDLAKWKGRHGHRTVPVELWAPSKSSGGTSSLSNMPLSRFIDEFLIPSNESQESAAGEHGYGPFPRNASATAPSKGAATGDEAKQPRIAYISQHGLFHQLRDTQAEFTVPVYARGGGKLVMVNMWMGTRGTVTHLHTDEHDNFLAQVAGFKFVRMCSPAYSSNLYAFPHPRATKENPLNWFSPVDAEQPDPDKHPDAAGDNIPWKEVILGPGDMLFIPKGHWHYVRALTTSVSINFWF